MKWCRAGEKNGEMTLNENLKGRMEQQRWGWGWSQVIEPGTEW